MSHGDENGQLFLTHAVAAWKSEKVRTCHWRLAFGACSALALLLPC
jgi:hypothetical protein